MLTIYLENPANTWFSRVTGVVRRCYHGGRLKVVRTLGTLGTRGCDGGCLGPRRTGEWFTWCNAQYTVQALYTVQDHHSILASCHGNIMTGDEWKLKPPFDFKCAEKFNNWKVISNLRIWVFAHRQTWTCNNINIWQTKHFPSTSRKS